MTYSSSVIGLIFIILFSNHGYCDPKNNSEFIWGIGTHLINRDNNVSYIPLIQAIGVGSIRDDATWGDVEKKPSIYSFPSNWDNYINATAATNVKPLLIIGFDNNYYFEQGEKPISDKTQDAFGNYAKQVVSHYKTKAYIYEIWNEWDMYKPKSAEAYVNLLKKAYLAIKEIDSNAIVLGGGIGNHSLQQGVFGGESWLHEFVKLGGLNYLDGLSVHPYVHCFKEPTPETFLKLLKEMMVATSSRPDLSIYITEMGWPNHNGTCGVSLEKISNYMLEVYLIAKCIPQVKGLWWYDLIDDGVDLSEREHNFGIYQHSLQPKKTFEAATIIGKLNEDISCEKPIEHQKEQGKYYIKGLGSIKYSSAVKQLNSMLSTGK